MLTPFDWQEGVGHRAGYIEAKLAHGSPVFAASCREGIALFTRRKQRPKVFEVYDRLVYSAIGQQSDIEALRVAAVEYAHREGYRGSEEDVTVQRVVNAMSALVKGAFSNFSVAPFVARSLFAEVGTTPEQDRFFVLDLDGDYTERTGFAWVVPETMAERAASHVDFSPSATFETTLGRMREVWAELADLDLSGIAEGFSDEAVLMSRDETRIARFQRIPNEP